MFGARYFLPGYFCPGRAYTILYTIFARASLVYTTPLYYITPFSASQIFFPKNFSAFSPKFPLSICAFRQGVYTIYTILHTRSRIEHMFPSDAGFVPLILGLKGALWSWAGSSVERGAVYPPRSCVRSCVEPRVKELWSCMDCCRQNLTF